MCDNRIAWLWKPMHYVPEYKRITKPRRNNSMILKYEILIDGNYLL